MGTCRGGGGPFSGGKARPERDADLSVASSAEVKNKELYLLSRLALSWRSETILRSVVESLLQMNIGH
jgi:hypothetical protein